MLSIVIQFAALFFLYFIIYPFEPETKFQLSKALLDVIEVTLKFIGFGQSPKGNVVKLEIFPNSVVPSGHLAFTLQAYFVSGNKLVII